ncbi:MAG: lipocalin/fatty-acid binding family protein [Myxococcota bacterium]
MILRLLCLAWLCLAALPTTALAAPPDFTGTWQLDRKASESLDPILKAQGVSYIKRKVVDGLSVTLEIQHSDSTFDVKVVTSRKTAQQKWVADNTPRAETRDGREITSRHAFVEDALVSTATGIAPSGDAFEMTTTRLISEDGQTMTLKLACEVDGKTTNATRVFRRES